MKIESDLLTLLEANPYQTYKTKELARALTVPSAQYQRFKRLVRNLIAEGKVIKYKKGRIGLGKRTSEIIGRLDVKTQGYGFLMRDDSDEDIFINHLNIGTAFNGDLVRVRLFAHTNGKSVEGKVIEVIKRARKNIVGTFQAGKNWGIVVPDDTRIQRDIYIPRDKSQNAASGQKVVVHLSDWEDEHLNPEGEIVEILGKPETPGVDIISIAKSYDLATDFSKEIKNEIKRLPRAITKTEIRRRKDLRDELCFTIDPADSKDFDDAVSLNILENGNYQLGVHIADVSHYVKYNTALDREARQRGTSIYLVDRVIPMLPEIVSNELCCLKPDEDKLCFSVIIELTASGEVVKYEIMESIVHSHRRFTYQEAQQLIEKPKKDKAYSLTLINMYELSKKLINKREQRGGLDFSSTEVKIQLDDQGKPVKIEKEIQLDSHRIIEELMVLANNIIASHIAFELKQRTGITLPFIYRIHEKPNQEKLTDFSRFTTALGLDFPLKKKVTPRMFQQLLRTIKGSDKQILVEDVMIRSMMKAKYDVKNIGHFGLALKNYCHFTSPIRRYPDLMCHRLLKDYLSNPNQIKITRSELTKICQLATEREILAQEAERASIKVKQVEFIEQHVGETFDGIISGVMPFGIFVELTENLIEGLVHITNLPDDYYIHDEQRHCLFGKNKGNIYQLGNHVKVNVLQVNREAKVIDFELSEDGHI